MNNESTVIIACGGTGGHLTPGIALAQELGRRGQKLTLAISHKKIDEQVLAAYPDFKFLKIPGGPLSKNPWQFLKSFGAQVRGFLFAIKFIRRQRPCVVVGFGGFGIAALVLAAWWLNQKVVLHESNRQVGRAVRWLARFADRVFLPTKVFLPGIKAGVLRTLGFPLRDELCWVPKEAARNALGLPKEGKLLLIFGGSQGAHALSDWGRQHMELLAEAGVHMVCITGLREPAQTLRRHTPDGRPIEFHFMPFCNHMAELLSAADLTVARSGAGSLAELARVGLPSILIPFPHAADDHQMANALYYERAGAASVLPQKRIKELWGVVQSLLFDEAALVQMKAALKGLDTENAQAIFADELCALIEGDF